jgi:hypothetical protein
MALITNIAGIFNRIASGIFFTAPPALANGQVHPLTLTGDARLRVEASISAAAAVNGVHVDLTSAALAAGANTVTFRTVPALTNSRLLSCVVAYTGTPAVGTSVQLRIGAVLVDLEVDGLVSGVFVRTLPAGVEILADAADTWQIQVEGAVVTDTIRVLAHFEETT